MDTLKMSNELKPACGVSIIFEDNHVLVAYKPQGVLSQADSSSEPDMLTILKDYIKVRDNKPGNVWLGLLHRLDRPVSGIMVFAKTSKCASRISEQIRQRRVVKRYRALVHGTLEGEGILDGYILKDSRTNTVKVFDEEVQGSKKAKLMYKANGAFCFEGAAATLVEVELETGRSHQIRAQFAGAGHPLLGDRRYGIPDGVKDIALQSFVLGFFHPVSGEYLEFTAPFPECPPWDVVDKTKYER